MADGGTAMGDALRARHRVRAHARPERERQRLPAPARGHRPAVRRQEHLGQHAAPGRGPQAKALKIPIYAIALGTPSGEIELTDPFSGATQTIAVPPDPQTLKEIARITGGRFFETAKAAELESIYANLGTRLSSKQEKREVTVAFAGGGLALLLVGGGLSLAWFGRLP